MSDRPLSYTAAAASTARATQANNPSASNGPVDPPPVPYGSGDTYLVAKLLQPELSQVAFSRVRDEVEWNKMHHRGGEVPRLVAVQGVISTDGSIPLYRHPSDQSPELCRITPMIALIANRVQQVLKHPVNHVLIQYYRTGRDHISEHADKTIDIVRGSNIVNVSLGATRTMVLRHKSDHSRSDNGSLQRSALPHNSMFVLGLKTNKEWQHGIHPIGKKRAIVGERISLTFRWIGTFLIMTKEVPMIYGQGAVGKTREEARPAVTGGRWVGRLIGAFGEENRDSNFDWDKVYGHGYDVLHFSSPGVTSI